MSKILITAGGTRAPIDEVRHIGNLSTGKYGLEMMSAALKQGHDVVIFQDYYSPLDILDFIPFGKVPEIVYYRDFDEYVSGVKRIITDSQPDVIISSAAVSDYVPVKRRKGKISSKAETITIKLKKTEKVIASFRGLAPKALIVGFKLLVGPNDEEKQEAITKVFNSGVNIVVFNDLLEIKKGNTSREVHFTPIPDPVIRDNAAELIAEISTWTHSE